MASGSYRPEFTIFPSDTFSPAEDPPPGEDPPKGEEGEEAQAPPPPPCTCVCQCVPVEGYQPAGIHPLPDIGVAIAYLPEAPDLDVVPIGGPAVEESRVEMLQESAVPGGQGDALSSYVLPWNSPPSDLPGGLLPGPQVLLPGSWRDREGDLRGGQFGGSEWRPPPWVREEKVRVALRGSPPSPAGPRVAAVEEALSLVPAPPGWGDSRPVELTRPSPWTVMPDDTLLGRSSKPPT